MSGYMPTQDTLVKKPRKPHRCWYCNGELPVGKPHWKRVGTNDGDFFEMRFHQVCETFAVEHLKYHENEDYEFHDCGEFRRELKEAGVTP